MISTRDSSSCFKPLTNTMFASWTTQKLADRLLRSGVILDCVLVGTQGDKMLPAMAKLTGGHVLIPTSPLDAITKLEAETMLKVAWRPLVDAGSHQAICSLKLINELLRKADPSPSQPRPVQASVVSRPTSSTLQDIVQGVVHDSASSTAGKALSASAGKARTARIMREFMQLDKNARRDRMRPFTSGDKIDNWVVLLQGPSSSAYDGVFHLDIEFGLRYPTEPPTVRFKPGTIKHVNIDSVSGRVCSQVKHYQHFLDPPLRRSHPPFVLNLADCHAQAFGSAYTATVTVFDLLIAVLSTLADPNADDA